MTPDLAVQIVSYRTRAYLSECLPSVIAALVDSGLTYDVAVLENGSGDDLSHLEERVGSSVRFLSSPTNRGFGGGHNDLATTSSSTYLCVLNPDVVLTDPTIFRRLIRHFADDRVAIVGPALRETNGDIQRWDHGELRGLRARVANAAGHAHWRPRTRPVDAAWVSGAFLVIRRSAFDDVGGFDERFFLYKEEEDLCLQVRRNGGRVIYDPSCEATHVGSVVAARQDHLVASDAAFAAKNYPSRARRRAFGLMYRVTRRFG
jgi:GT2 family glycosyltransferase